MEGEREDPWLLRRSSTPSSVEEEQEYNREMQNVPTCFEQDARTCYWLNTEKRWYARKRESNYVKILLITLRLTLINA